MSQFDYFPTYGILKRFMVNCHRPEVRSVFGIHDPQGIHYLFQSRLGLSPLHSYKKRFGFIDTPSD